MSLESYIQAMPKVDINLHFEGALPRELLTRLVDQNDIAASMRQREYNEWMGLLQKPDMKKLDDMGRMYASWLKYPEDIARAIYDVGMALYKQNVRYAELHINPAIYTDNGLTFEQFMDAINDGRDKMLRGWNVRLDWVLTIPRDRPRKGDDISRWVTGSTARKGNVVGMGIDGREETATADQFSKTFAVVEKRDVPTMVSARSTTANPEPLQTVLSELHPTRLVDLWNVVNDEETLEVLRASELPVVLTPSRDLRMGRLSSLSDYPLRELMNVVPVAISGGYASFYRTGITQELVLLSEALSLTADEVDQLVLNGVRASFMAPESKEAMAEEFAAEFATLRAEHLSE